MRQLLILVLVAALGWFAYDKYLATPAEAASGGGGDGVAVEPQAEGAAANPLEQLLGSAPAPAAPEVATGGVERVPTPSAALASGAQEALDALLERIGDGNAVAIGQGWQLLAAGTLAAPVLQRVGEALAPGAPSDFAARLKALGRHNAFLHSARGRAQATEALTAALALADPEAVAAGSQLLGLCLRGSIEKAHHEQRAFVDALFARYRPRAESWLCSPSNVAGSRSYTVAAGDSLDRIARKFRSDELPLESGTLALLNRISNPGAIRIGQPLKIPLDPVRVVIEKRSFALGFYVGDHLLRLYWVGHGKGDKTPVTTFAVESKIPHPPWTAPDGNQYPYGHPKNILGEYWIGLRGDYSGFGIHGTPMPATVGTMSSDGCIRMLAPDIAELFGILPRGAKVEIRASASS